MDQKKFGKNILKEIFLDHWESFKEHYGSYDCDQYNVPVEKMLNCLDASQGYACYVCESCGDQRRVSFSCKSSFCLSCSKLYSEDVVHEVSRSLHGGINYLHIVLTVPSQLRTVFYNYRSDGKFLSEFIKVAYNTVSEVIKRTESRKLLVGVIGVVHTHGRSGSYNPHVHLLVSQGGLDSLKVRWYELKFLPYGLLNKLWQKLLCSFLIKSVGESINDLIVELQSKYKEGFVCNVSGKKAPISHLKSLKKYLAKYLSSPPISARRILSYDGEWVLYCYKDHKSKKLKKEKVRVFQFIGRLVQHIRVKGFQKIRYYGIQATRSYQKVKASIMKSLSRIGRKVSDVLDFNLLRSWRDRFFSMTGKDPLICNNCGGVMSLWYLWSRRNGVFYDVYGNAPLVQERSSPIDIKEIEKKSLQLQLF